MRTTILMAGLLAGLGGAAALAQTAQTPEPGATPPAQAEPVPVTPQAGDEAPGMDRMDDMMGRMMEHMGDMGGMEGMGPGGRVPNMAPLMLAIYDTDGDGKITQEEIEAKKAARFAAADADGNGGLSSEELVSLEDAIRQEVRLARATGQIEGFDDNGDGLLQATEIEARTPRLAPVFDRLDTDDDGGISQEELDAARPERGSGGGPEGFFRRFMEEHGRDGHGMGGHGRMGGPGQDDD